MSTSDDVIVARRRREGVPRSDDRGRFWRARSLTGGGTDGNEHLTALTGAILIVLLAVLGFTIPQLRQFIWLHLFVGFLLIGPVLLKMATTAYRFMRYYTRNAEYRRKGPPEWIMRLSAPVVVLSTAGVFVTGIALVIAGPAHRDPWLLLHKVTFIVWIVFAGLHILWHLPEVARALGFNLPGAGLSVPALGLTVPGAEPPAAPSAGAAGRWIAMAGALVAGLVLAIVLIPDFAAWTAHGVFVHHHEH